MPRIQSMFEPMPSAIARLVDGNIGAANAIINCCKQAPEIDPDSALEAWGPIFALDTLEIYGPDIWLLYKDICQEDAKHMIGMLRAVQLGILSESTLKNAIRGARSNGPKLDVEAILQNVRANLPNFKG